MSPPSNGPGPVSYRPVDVRSAEAVRACVDAIRAD